MPDICIYVGYIDVSGGNIQVNGEAIVDGQSTKVEWGTTFSWNAIPSAANSAIVDAAIEAAETAFSITIGISDNKTLLGGVVGLV
jgi:hypothetical protein